MKLGHDSEIKFDATGGTVTRYLVTIEGEPTMQVLCDTADPNRTIRIARHGIDSVALTLDTKGRFEMAQKLLEGPEGAPLGVESRVDSKTVYMYVIPRLPLLLARLLRAS